MIASGTHELEIPNEMLRRCWTLCFLLPLLSAGCSPPVATGFLAPYDGFRRFSLLNSDVEYVNPRAQWKAYTKVRIFPSVVYNASGTYEGDPNDEITLATYLDKELVESFKGEFKLVSEPGPDVVDIRAAITNLHPTHVLKNAAAQTGELVIPVAWFLGVEGYKAISGDQLGMGEAQVEAEFRDSMTQERVYGYVSRRVGSFLDVRGQTTSLGVIETALTKWAHILSRQLLHLKNPSQWAKFENEVE